MIILVGFVCLFFVFTLATDAFGDHKAADFFQKLFCIAIFFLLMWCIANSGLL